MFVACALFVACLFGRPLALAAFLPDSGPVAMKRPASVTGSKPDAKKRRSSSSRGSKSEPQCTHCGGQGHYASSCSDLGKKLLSLLATKTHSSQKLQKFLSDASSAQIMGCPKKPLKSLKRSKGNRHFRARKASEAGKNPKSQRGSNAKVKHKKREKLRRPRSFKDESKQVAVTRDSVKAAHAFLKRTGWCWKPGRCECGGTFEALSFQHCESRGHGRRFVRCSDCSSYRDVLTWSHLPKLRMPLPSVVAAMKHWFGGSVPPSADHVGRLLGLSGKSATSLKSLLSTLASHEADLANDMQSRTILSGRAAFRP